MSEKQTNLSRRLKLLGFAKGHQMKLYGEVFDRVFSASLRTLGTKVSSNSGFKDGER